jgi:hypothetical protein
MPTYILPEHVDHLKTICEFINVFEASWKLTSFSLGLVLIGIN